MARTAQNNAHAQLTADILAAIKSPAKDDGSTPVVDFVVDRTAKTIDGASRLVGAFGSAFTNAGAFYRLETGVQKVRAEARLKKAAEDAAARILALG